MRFLFLFCFLGTVRREGGEKDVCHASGAVLGWFWSVDDENARKKMFCGLAPMTALLYYGSAVMADWRGERASPTPPSSPRLTPGNDPRFLLGVCYVPVDTSPVRSAPPTRAPPCFLCIVYYGHGKTLPLPLPRAPPYSTLGGCSYWGRRRVWGGIDHSWVGPVSSRVPPLSRA